MKNVLHKNIWKTSRKGIVDVQFNWIFVLIAGFIIFLFIIGIVYSQKKNSDAQAGISAINQITTILKSKQQTSDVYSEVNLPKSSISFSCDAASKYFTFKIENGERTQLPTEIIFAPQNINTNKIIVWTQSFDMGFPVNVFSYITTPDSIILIYNTSVKSAYAKILYDDIPGNITHKYISKIDEYGSFNRRRIICFAGDCPTGNPGTDGYLMISPAQDTLSLYDYGTVTYKKGSSTSSSTAYPYISKAGLLGAIFSDNEGFYVCQMSRLMSEFDIKRTIAETRLNLIDADLTPGTCEEIINVTINLEFNELAQFQGKKFSQFTLEDVKNLSDTVGNIDTRNTDLKLYSCPKIY